MAGVRKKGKLGCLWRIDKADYWQPEYFNQKKVTVEPVCGACYCTEDGLRILDKQGQIVWKALKC